MRGVAPGSKVAGSQTEQALSRKLHQTIRKITQDFQGRWHFNTCIAAIMELVNELTAADAALGKGEVKPEVLSEILRSLILLLAPFAPFLSAELWQEIGAEGSILRTPWPKFEEALAKENEIEIPVQVNGKLRSLVRIAAEATPQEMEKAALADAKLQASVAGKQVVKVIVVPGKMVNVVVR